MEKILDLQNQSSLAKLLATENITVTHSKSLSTAYFDVKNRVLGLPVWKDQGKVVYDMLVGHEVSHALYTPHQEFDKFLKNEGRSHFDILNIIEDIRIERLIKLKYPGMPRIFNGAYKSLVEGDFFNIAGKNLDDLNFLDRLNLKAKIGPHVEIPLSDEELAIFNKCLKAETFEEVIELYHETKDFIAKEAKNKPEAEKNQEVSSSDDQDREESSSDNQDGDEENETEEGTTSSPSNGSDDDSDDGEEAEGESTNDAEGDDEASSEDISSENNEESSGETTFTDGAGDAQDPHEQAIDDFKSETLESFKENIQESEDSRDTSRAEIAMMPLKSSIDSCVIPYSKVLAERPRIEDIISVGGPYESLNNNHEAAYIDLKKTVNKRASVLAREFERRKASYQYSRAQESRNGTIDVNNLHKYKYDDQIFSTTMRLADAKSHGMIFFIDYSGSMNGVLKDVLEHTLNLIQFCKKVGIPFQVYSFTSLHLNDHTIEQNDYEFNLANVVIAELFSSDMKKAEYEQAFKTVAYQIIFSKNVRYADRFGSHYERLGGTPLDHTLIAAHTIIDRFNKKHAVQKTNVVVLSDGESARCNPNNSNSRRKNKIVTTINRKQYEINRYNATVDLANILKKATGVTLIGFYLPYGKAASTQKVRSMVGWNNPYRNEITKYKKAGFFHKTDFEGFDSYFLLSENIEIAKNEFEFGEDEVANSRTAQSRLAKSYATHNAKNRQNRIILNKFAEIVA